MKFTTVVAYQLDNSNTILNAFRFNMGCIDILLSLLNWSVKTKELAS